MLVSARTKKIALEYLVNRSISDRLGDVVRHFLESIVLSSNFVFSKIQPDRKESGDSLINKLGAMHDSFRERTYSVHIHPHAPEYSDLVLKACLNADTLPFELFRMWEGFEALVVELT